MPAVVSTLVALVLVSGLRQSPPPSQSTPPAPFQVEAPVFRAGTLVVPVRLTLNYKQKPWTGLTSADVLVTLDKTSIVPIEVQHDDAQPNHYTVFFQPADTARDGKPHVLQIKVRKPGSKDWTTLPAKVPLTLAKASDRTSH